jgi:hypothetical protein
MDKTTSQRAIGAPEALADLFKGLDDRERLLHLLAAARDEITLSSRQAADTLAGDILYGADGIATFLYGDGKLRRKVYNLVETERLPHFRLGAVICARKSVLLKWIETQEVRPSRSADRNNL